MTNGVPQGSVKGLQLLIIYVKELEMGISSDVSKPVDNTKISRVIISDHNPADVANTI